MTPGPKEHEITAVKVFVGRDSEISQLKAGLEDALSGRGRLYLLSGEPGIGKTRLAEEVAAHATSKQAHIAWGRCWNGGGAPAYWPWIQIIRSCIKIASTEVNPLNLGAAANEIAQILPELARMTPQAAEATARDSDPEQAQFRLFESITRLLEEVARRRPLVIILDDLHDSDRLSLLLLRFAARELRNFHGLFLGTYRDSEVSSSDVLSPIMAEVAREGTEFKLVGLRQDDIAQMVERSAGLPGPSLSTLLHRATGGNPLFLEGVVRIMVADGKKQALQRLASGGFRIPSGIRDSIRERLGALSKETIEILGIAATIGEEFELKILRNISDIRNEDLLDLLETAVSGGMLTETNQVRARYRFSHALIRAALHEELRASQQVKLHARIGEELERAYRGTIEDHLAELAYHFCRASRAGSSGKALSYSIRAGDAAFRLFAFEEASLHWQSALDLLEANAADAETRAKLLERLGEATMSTDLAKGVEHLKQALRLYEGCGLKERAGEVHSRIGGALAIRSPIWNIPEAFEHLRKAEALLGEGAETQALGRLYVALAQAAEHLADIEQGIRASRRAMEIGERLSDERILTNASVQHATHLMRRGQLSDARILLDRAWEKADRLDDGFLAAWYGGYYRLALWDGKEAELWYRRELVKPRMANAHFPRFILSNAIALALSLSGELDEARDLVANSSVGLGKGAVCYFGGEWEQAEALFSQGLEQSRRVGTKDEQVNFMQYLAVLFRSREQHAEAETLLRQVIEICPEGRHWQMAMRPDLALIYANLGRIEEALPHIDYCNKILSEGEDWRALAGHLAHAEGVICAAQGRTAQAEDLFMKAIAIFRRYCIPWSEAEVYVYWGRHLRDLKQPEPAIAKFDAALAVYQRINASIRWIVPVKSEKERIQGAAVSSATVTGLTADHPNPIEPSQSSPNEVVLRKEGEYWTIIRKNKVMRLKAVKGLALISTLVHYPNKEFHARDLEGGEGEVDMSSLDESEDDFTQARSSAAGLERHSRDDAGEILDIKAKKAYEQAIAELREDLKVAKRLGQETRAEEIEEEIEALVDQLRQGVGLHGRLRPAASVSEKARLNVRRAIKAAIDKVCEGDLELGRLLERTIKTGTFCCYVPDSENPVSWKF